MPGHRLARRALLRGAAALGLAPALKPRAGRAAGMGVLRMRASADLQVLDPAHRKGQPEGDVMACLFPKLIEHVPGDAWRWRLAAAEAVEQVDATHVRFRLRRGVAFTGGFGELTADDVRFSYERIADPRTASPYRDDLAALDRIDVLDRYAGVIVLREPFAPLWTSTLPSASGCIVSRAAVEQAGGAFTTTPPATAGPYVIGHWRPKQRLSLVRNPDWPGPPGGFAEIRILPIEDEKAAEVAFEAGELDFTAVSVGSIPLYAAAPPAGARLIRKPSLDYTWLGMNMEATPFDDPRVRRAVQRAIDVDLVLEAAYGGIAERATGIIAPGLPGHRERNLTRHDLAGARRLLAEAGLAGGFRCTLDVQAKTEHLSAAQVMQASLGELGIEVQINRHDSGTFWSLGSEAEGERWRQLQLILQEYGMQPDPSFATAWFTPEQVGIWNWERFRSREFGDLHRRALVEADPGARHRMYVRMQDLMEQSGAYLFLTHEVNAALCSDAVLPALLPDGNPVLPDFRPA